MLKKIINPIHSLLGTAISLLFLMWFLTGLVLLYKPFPNVTKANLYQNMEVLPDSLPPLQTILDRLTEGEDIQKIALRQMEGQSVFDIKTKEGLYTLLADSSQAVKPFTYSTIEHTASQWVDAPIAKVDTLTEAEQWIMYTKYLKEMPIYKVYFDNEAQNQLYISSQSGEVQQFTNKDERFWAYLGFIPHTLYIPALRKNTEVWIDTITILASIGLIACLSGIYVGVNAYRRRYKLKGKLESPYKKWSFRWHHIFGMIFSIFLVSWSISGIISLRKVPQWIVKTHTEYKIPHKMKGKRVALDQFAYDYTAIRAKYPDLKRVEWSYFQGTPVYECVVGDKEVHFDANSEQVNELYISQAAIGKSMTNIHGDSAKFSVTLITEHEEYYLPWKRELTLPAYKVCVDDADNSMYFISPHTGAYKYVNDNRRARKWLFSGMHYFNIKWLVDRPVLWTITIWTLTLGCTLVSATGVWMGGKYIIRKRRKIFRKKDKKC